jgi:hypothetical protein
MMFQNAARIIVVLAVTTVMAQSNPPATTVPGGANAIGQRQALAARRMASLGAKRPSAVPTPTPLRQRLEDLDNTVNQMHTVLKQMQAKAAKSGVKDSIAKANLDMWGLMVGHLDKELQELRVAVAQREDMEARRAALYKQADAKGEAEAQAARAAQAAKFGVAAPTPNGQGSGQSPAGQTAPEQSSTPPASNSPAPN